MRLSLLLLIGIGWVIGCAQPEFVEPAKTQPPAAKQAVTTPLENGEPSHITVQHILIGFSGSVPGKPIRLKKEEAQKLAAEVLQKAKSGDDFDQLVKTHTNDSPPGIYKMANHGFEGDMTSRDQSNWVYKRGGMVPAFGNVGFKLEVGEIGMSDFDEDASPFGWHIIKRLK